MGEGLLTIAIRVNELPVPHIRDSVKRECGNCHEEIWVSPATLELEVIYKDAGHQYQCTVCFEQNLDRAVEAHSKRLITRGQAKELFDAIGEIHDE